MKYLHTLFGILLIPTVLFTSACSNSSSFTSSSSAASESSAVGYAFTGITEYGVEPDTIDPDLGSLVLITDPDLKAVLNYDQSKTMEVQQAELQVVDQNNQVVGSETVNVWIRSTENPAIELITPEGPVSAADFSIQNCVHAAMKRADQTVSLEWVSSQDLVSGKAGFVLYDLNTGLPINPGTPWLDGDYSLSVLVSDGSGLTVQAQPLAFTIAG